MRDTKSKKAIPIEPRGLSQKNAAAYLGVSPRWFRDNVHVNARPVGETRPGRKPVLRYRREELDAWMDHCATYRMPRAKTAATAPATPSADRRR
jgi:hypothetical protein